MKITQPEVDKIVLRAKELGAGEGLTYKNGLFELDTYAGDHDLETLAHVLVNGWHGKYELIAAMWAGLEFVEQKLRPAPETPPNSDIEAVYNVGHATVRQSWPTEWECRKYGSTALEDAHKAGLEAVRVWLTHTKS